MTDLLSVSEALQQILRAFSAVSTEPAGLTAAGGRVLAQDVVTTFPIPPFANSSMDGFAVRAADVQTATPGQPVRLQVIGDIPAGSFPSFPVGQGQAARIMTGAPMPAGTDAVVPVEQTDFPYREYTPALPESVGVHTFVKAGDNVRPAGQDLQPGQRVLRSGHLLKPQDVGILASLGVPQVEVFRRPRVALISSGDELLTPEQPLAPGKIYDANSYMLGALIQQQRAKVLHLGFAKDDPEQVDSLFQQASKQNVDLILTSAGVSVGAFDFVRAVIEQNGRLTFWRVNMRPGKPLAFGQFKDCPVIGLPGNPVSAFVGFQVFVVPVLRRLAGLPDPRRQIVHARLLHSVESDGRETYLRGMIQVRDGEYTAALTGHQGSGNIYSLVLANALLIVPSGVKSLPTGTMVAAWLLDPELQLEDNPT